MTRTETEASFLKLAVERPYGEPGVFIGDSRSALIAKLAPEFEGLAFVLAAAPQLLEACIQGRAALPDASFAEKNGVKVEVIRELDEVLSGAAERGQRTDGVYHDGRLIATIYAGQERYVPLFADAARLLKACVAARAELPAAWKAVKQKVPADVLALLNTAIAAGSRTT